MTESEEDAMKESRFSCVFYRFIVLVSTLVQLSLLLSSVITFNSCFIPMQEIKTSPLYDEYLNDTSVIPDWSSSELSLSSRRFVFTPLTKSLSFAGAFGGAVAGVQPMVVIIRRFGVHRSIIATGIVAASAVAVTPFAISTSFIIFFIIRCINGFTFSMLFTVAGIVCNDWAPLVERGIFVAALTGHVELAALFTMPVGSYMASHVGWPSSFFLNGGILATSTLIFAFVYRDDPASHPFVSSAELRKIQEGKAKGSTSSEMPPFRAILSSPVIWASWIAVIGTFFVSQFTITWSPIYLNKVLHHSPSTTGLITVVPLVTQLIIKVVSGFFSDKVTCIDEVMKFRFFNSIALVGCAVFFSIVTVVYPSGSMIDTVLAMTPVALLGFHAGGYPKCIVVVSRQYSAFVMSVVQMVSCSTMFVGSFVVPLLTPNDSFEEWRKVFILYAVLLVITNTIFVIYASAKPASWTMPNANKNKVCIQNPTITITQ